MTIWLPDGTQHTIFKPEDFHRLIVEKLGSECGQYVQELIDEGDYAARAVDTDLSSYESSLDSYNSMCSDIMDYVRSLEAELSKERINRKSISSDVAGIRREIENQY